MLPNNSFSSLIIQNETLADMGQLAGRGKLGAASASMNHESGIPSGNPVLCPQISDNSDRTDLSSVIQRDFNGYSAEEVVKEHSVSDVTPSRLEERMNMLYFTARSSRSL